ncbi:MAG TPA: hypothetical protein VE959_36835 [Bryobacteraceae bacterium]|nr:hypothetical protein [Bryobacteraceae bacterium]
MHRTFLKVIGLSLISLALVFQAAAAPQAKNPPKMGQLSGNVQGIAKASSEITLQKGNTKRIVIYSADTKFNMGSSKKSTPSSIDQVKEGNYMYCGGPWNGVKLAATTCTFRATK